MEFRILGPLEVVCDGRVERLAAAKERALLCLLLIESNRVVSSDRLIEELWEDRPPDSPATSLRVLVSRLRKTLGALEPDERVVTRAPGYQLVVGVGELDAARFEALVAQGRAAMAAGDPDGASSALRAAGELWRGPAFAEVAERPFARADAARLDEARLGALEERVEADLAAGRHASLVAELEGLTSTFPLRERLWAARMLALYRSGRQADALRVYQDLRRHLGDELGIEPSPTLVALETALVRQEPSLAWAAPVTVSAVIGTLPSGVVTFLLTDIEGSTPLWESHRDVMGDVLARHDEMLRSIVTAHHGTLLRARGEGDSTFSVFSRATDAAEAALEAQHALANEPWPSGVALRVRMAIHAGETFERDGEYQGTTVNRAARLRAVATGGQIVVSSSTADVIIDHLDDASLVELGEHSLRGLSRRERVFELQRRETGGVAAAVGDDDLLTPIPGPLTRVATGVFVGRDAELARLTELWNEVGAGERRLAFLSGEPGIGKTRLAAEFASQVHADRGVVMFGRCDEDAGEPYQPFAEATRTYLNALAPGTLVRHLGTRAPQLNRLVPHLVPQLRATPQQELGDADTQRRALFDAVAAQLASLSSVAPVLVVLDDLHWADRPTLLLLRHLVRADDIGRVLIVATYRDTDIDRSHPLAETLADLRREIDVTRLALSGLDPAGICDFMEATAGQSLEDAERRLAEAVHAETEGNPFFVQEMFRHLVETGAVYRADGRWHTDFEGVSAAGLPEGVRDVVTRRLGRLSEAANRALLVAAVIGPEFNLAVLEHVREAGGGDDGLLDVVEEAVRAGLVSETAANRYAFSHALIRQTLYDELTSTRRARLHRRIGEAIELRSDAATQVEALSFHFAEAALDGQVAKAADYALAAGRHAIERLAHEQAITHLQRGLDALELDDTPDPIRSADLSYELAVAKWSAGDRKGARAAAHVAAKFASEVNDAVRFGRSAVLAIGTAAYREVARPTAEICERAVEMLGDNEPGLRARLLAGLARYRAGPEARGPEGAALAADAILIARQAGDAATLVSALHARFLALLGLGQPDAQLALANEMVELTRPLADPRRLADALQARCTAHFAVGDLVGCHRDLDELEALGHAQQAWRVSAIASALRAGCALARGQLAECAALSSSALRQADNDIDIVALVGGITLTRHAFEGRYARAAETTRAVVERAPGLESVYKCILVAQHAAAGEADAAHNLLGELVSDGDVTLPHDLARPGCLSILTETCCRLDDRGAGRAVYDALLPLEGTLIMAGNTTATNGHAGRFLGMLAALDERWHDAERHFQSALETEERLDFPAALASTRYWYARMLVGRHEAGDYERAMSLLGQALGVAVELGMNQVAADSQGLLRPAGDGSRLS